MTDDRLVKKVRGLQDAIKNSLCEKPVSDYTAYMRLVGRHEGLEEALQLILAQDKED